jgi:hypothetical protein
MHHEPTALDREPQADAIFGWRGALLVQKRRVDFLNMDTAVLHRLDRAGDLDQFAGGCFKVGVDTGFGELHWFWRLNPVGAAVNTRRLPSAIRGAKLSPLCTGRRKNC